jgi:hypothetical protein
MWRGHLALVPDRWQDASETQGWDGLATVQARFCQNCFITADLAKAGLFYRLSASGNPFINRMERK